MVAVKVAATAPLRQWRGCINNNDRTLNALKSRLLLYRGVLMIFVFPYGYRNSWRIGD
ncbi:hypothetical protein [Chroococcidiopsis sp. CCMEE 29]|uniref:hypothetical protein n=1 Tax=Chroococcidiopsis sp. CCMEE 29 TaxID=155894 RepID=UPI0020229785|nr:hypothetical protein [Chroococcidiopsis sp. CCMEE 29]